MAHMRLKVGLESMFRHVLVEHMTFCPCPGYIISLENQLAQAELARRELHNVIQELRT